MLLHTGLARWLRIPQTQTRKRGMSVEETRTEARRCIELGKRGMLGTVKAEVGPQTDTENVAEIWDRT